MTFDRKAYMKEYYQKPEVKQRVKEYLAKPEIIAKRKRYMKIYNQKPEVKLKARLFEQTLRGKEIRRNYDKRRRRRKPEYKARQKEYQKEYDQRSEVKIKRKDYHKNPKEKAKRKEYYYKNKEQIKQHNQRSEVKEKIRIRGNAYHRYKRKTDIVFNLKGRLRGSLNKSLRIYSKTGKINSSKAYGINWKEVIEHLKPFPKDFENYHIDHIIPLSMWDLNNSEHIRKSHLPHNLQWLTIEKNMEKGNRLVMPH